MFMSMAELVSFQLLLTIMCCHCLILNCSVCLFACLLCMCVYAVSLSMCACVCVRSRMCGPRAGQQAIMWVSLLLSIFHKHFSISHRIKCVWNICGDCNERWPATTKNPTKNNKKSSNNTNNGSKTPNCTTFIYNCHIKLYSHSEKDIHHWSVWWAWACVCVCVWVEPSIGMCVNNSLLFAVRQVINKSCIRNKLSWTFCFVVVLMFFFVQLLKLLLLLFKVFLVWYEWITNTNANRMTFKPGNQPTNRLTG